ncbi:unnamed protein product [Rotaria sp. Silwood1]|nr:unnamed protein product [Rotaria sp. Silwood1]
MHARKIDSFEALIEQDKKAAKILIELAQNVEPVKIEGRNIAIFGLTSTGKSTLVNSLMGKKVAATGRGETTTEIQAYPREQFTIWDVPGRNDETFHMTMEYISISFFKGLTIRLITIQCTVKESSSTMKFLDELGLDYDIIVNKFDTVDEDERDIFREQIHREIRELGLKNVNKVFFVSAKHQQMFPDWITMVDYLTNAQ